MLGSKPGYRFFCEADLLSGTGKAMGDTLFVLIGQAGISVGSRLFDQFAKRYGKKYPFWSSIKNEPRAVIVDTEYKVASAVTEDGAALDGARIEVARCGRGGNWACGYHWKEVESEGSSRAVRWNSTISKETANDDESLLSRAMECIRLQCEAAMAHSFVVMHSLAGGTGSGLGSRIICELRQSYPNMYIASVSIAPFQSGENPLQNYNMVLSGAILQECVDVGIIFQNGSIMKGSSKKSWSMIDINDTIANSLASVLMPINDGCGSRDGNIWELSASVCPSPSWKFVDTFSHHLMAGSVYEVTSPTIVDKFLQKIPKYTLDKKNVKTISAQLIFRGLKSKTLKVNIPALEKTANARLNPVDWNPFPVDMRFDVSSPQSKVVPSVALLANRTDVVDPFRLALEKSKDMFKVGAYWHWYTKYGVTDTDMLDSMDSIQNVIDAYDDI